MVETVFLLTHGQFILVILVLRICSNVKTTTTKLIIVLSSLGNVFYCNEKLLFETVKRTCFKKLKY